ncbi:unnamed protein product [Owenia fusiformis]|uniref:(3R)-3-hydroxyacyl-CoA dehydrogenase n=1 Tax=Owenia fusiformis TaxID=6347 RepID=A0A8J1U8R2_OWEFU|nr:unnamed protein product [Owenia fusiformis]
MLANRLAFVTGGGSGIGRAICQSFLKEGAKVAIVDINKNAAEDTANLLEGNDNISVHEVDVSNAASIAQALVDVKSKFSQTPCIGINSAGITRDNWLLSMTEEAFDEVIAINLKGTYLINQAVSKLMVEDQIKNGSIVNISSIIGKQGAMGQVNYAAAKAGVLGITKTAARELSKFGIRCNAVAPGFIETPMTAVVPEKVVNFVLKSVPLQRAGRPEEVAHACLFLASENSSYITGACLDVNGGLSMD